MLSIIATVSTEEAAVALGIRPPTVRAFIKSGKLAAARIGKSWRVGVESINALLAGACPTSLVVVPKLPELDASKSIASARATALPPAPKSPVLVTSTSVASATPTHKPDADDLHWLGHYRAQLQSSDHATRANAAFQLGMLTRRIAVTAPSQPAKPVAPPQREPWW